MTRITRVEVITDTGRDYVCWEEDNDITVSYQDDGKTLKVFVNTMKPKSPAEEAYKRVYGAYPMGEPFWIVFEKGYNASQKDYKVGEFQPTPQEPEDNEWKTVALGFGEKLSGYLSDGYYELSPAAWFRWAVFTYGKTQQIKELVRESVKWCEKHPDESVEDYLRPKTPEQTEKSLKEAFVKAQQTEEWKETQRKIDAPKESWMNKSDEELVAILEKNPPDCLRFELSPSLEDRIYKWWETCFVHHPEWSMEECVEDLLDIIELYLPRFQSASGSQSLGVEDMVEGFNDCLKKIKSKLRNKKDT